MFDCAVILLMQRYKTNDDLRLTAFEQVMLASHRILRPLLEHSFLLTCYRFVTQDGEGFKEPKRILKDDELNPLVRSSASNESHDGSQSSERDKTPVLSEISGGTYISKSCVVFVCHYCESFLIWRLPRVSGNSNKTKEVQAVVSQQTTGSSDTAVRISIQYLSRVIVLKQFTMIIFKIK